MESSPTYLKNVAAEMLQYDHETLCEDYTDEMSYLKPRIPNLIQSIKYMTGTPFLVEQTTL